MSDTEEYSLNKKNYYTRLVSEKIRLIFSPLRASFKLLRYYLIPLKFEKAPNPLDKFSMYFSPYSFLKQLLLHLKFRKIKSVSSTSLVFAISAMPIFPVSPTKVDITPNFSVVLSTKNIEGEVDSLALRSITIKEPPQPIQTEQAAEPPKLTTIQKPPPATSKPKINTPSVAVPIINYSTSGFVWPVAGNLGQISRGVGGGHTGVDIWDKSSPLVIACFSGTVIRTGWENGGAGNAIRIRLDNGFEALYAHTVGDFRVLPGQRVTQGTPLATMGQSGSATGIHLHIEFHDASGRLLNPLDYIHK